MFKSYLKLLGCLVLIVPMTVINQVGYNIAKASKHACKKITSYAMNVYADLYEQSPKELQDRLLEIEYKYKVFR